MSGIDRRAFLSGGVALAALARAGRAFAGQEQVYSNARVLFGTMPADGPTEVRGGVRVVDGVIAEIGPSVTGGVDLGGATIWPGLWDAGTSFGLTEIDLEGATHDDAEGGDAFQPQLRVPDAYNPASAVLPVLRARGVMGGLVTPGGGVVSGQAAWMRTSGRTVAEATVQDPAGLVIHLGRAAVGGSGPGSRLGVAARLRDVLDANPVPPAPAEPKRGHKPAPPETPPTRAQEAWRALRAGTRKAIFVAERASDIELACGLAQDYALDAVLLGGAEAWMVADLLHEVSLPVLLGPVTTQPDSYEHLHARYDNAALLYAAGVRLALRMGDPHRAYDLAVEAGIAVANGLPWAVAIAAVGGNGPGFFGLTQGRLRVGAEASFVVSDGDPLEPRSRVARVVVRGEDAPLANHQTELYDRFRVLR